MISVAGYSGCGIQVFRAPGKGSKHFVLEKNSPNASYAPRLLLQAHKQAFFYSQFDCQGSRGQQQHQLPLSPATPGASPAMVAVPYLEYVKITVVERTEDGEERAVTETMTGGDVDLLLKASRRPGVVHAVMGMHFERHSEALSYLQGTTIYGVRSLGSTLAKLVRSFVAHSPVTEVPTDLFSSKLKAVEDNLRKCEFIPAEDKRYLLEVALPLVCQQYLAEGAVLRIPVGRCHGDLTLSNVLIVPEEDDSGTPTTFRKGTPMRVILIDFLDSFVESPLADLAKLCQDLRFGWTLRLTRDECEAKGKASPHDATKLFNILDFLWTGYIQPEFKDETWFQQYITLFCVVNQLRVLQYSTNAQLAHYLTNTVRELLS